MLLFYHKIGLRRISWPDERDEEFARFPKIAQLKFTNFKTQDTINETKNRRVGNKSLSEDWRAFPCNNTRSTIANKIVDNLELLSTRFTKGRRTPNETNLNVVMKSSAAFGDCGQFQSFNLSSPINWQYYATHSFPPATKIVSTHIAEFVESKHPWYHWNLEIYYWIIGTCSLILSE